MTIRWRRVFIGAAILAVTTLLAFLFRDVIRTVFTRPLYNLYQFLAILVLSIPQRLLWLALLAVSGTLAFRMLAVREPKQSRGKRKNEGYRSRVEIWESWLSLAQEGDLYRFKLTRELGNLGLQSLAFRDQMSLSELWKHIRSGELDLPEDLNAFITAAPTPTASNFIDLIQKRLQSGFQLNGKANHFEDKIQNVVQYLESQLAPDRNHTLEESRDKSIHTV